MNHIESLLKSEVRDGQPVSFAQVVKPSHILSISELNLLTHGLELEVFFSMWLLPSLIAPTACLALTKGVYEMF